MLSAVKSHLTYTDLSMIFKICKICKDWFLSVSLHTCTPASFHEGAGILTQVS